MRGLIASLCALGGLVFLPSAASAQLMALGFAGLGGLGDTQGPHKPFAIV